MDKELYNSILNKDIKWHNANTKTEGYAFSAQVERKSWKIKVNPDFPFESLYTLFIEGKKTINFNDWPKMWTKPGQ